MRLSCVLLLPWPNAIRYQLFILVDTQRLFCPCSIYSVIFNLQATEEALVAFRLQEPIVFDGKADEAFWNKIVPFDLVTQIPEFGANSSERTEIRLAYDDSYIYLSGKMYDSELG